MLKSRSIRARAARASAWNGALNILQYVVPILVIAVAMRVLFRALKPRRSRRRRAGALKARTA